MCKSCYFHSSSKGVCTKKHIRVNDKSKPCAEYIAADEFVEKDTRTCRTCKHHFIPEKDYKNIHYYYNYKGEYFLCKCPFYNAAKFLDKDKCNKYETI